jgi:hypothetical protein
MAEALGVIVGFVHTLSQMGVRYSFAFLLLYAYIYMCICIWVCIHVTVVAAVVDLDGIGGSVKIGGGMHCNFALGYTGKTRAYADAAVDVDEVFRPFLVHS